MPETVQKPLRKSRAAAKAAENARLRQACLDLNMPLAQVLAWKCTTDRIVILFKNGQKCIWKAEP